MFDKKSLLRYLKNFSSRILIAILLLLFAFLTAEVRESDAGQPELVGQIDRTVLNFAHNLRKPVLTLIAVDITSLGSTVVLSFITLLTTLLLLFKSKCNQTLQLLIVAVGSGLLSIIMKSQFERSRPPLIGRLVEVQGYSYPSGHSLTAAAVYSILALLTCGFYPKLIHRVAIFAFAFVLIGLIGFSRVYLGVHYPTDVFAGILTGTSWALLVSYFVSARRLNPFPQEESE